MSAIRLDQLLPGRPGRVVEVSLADPLLVARLAHFGLVPGALLEVERAWPAAILHLGETTLALDSAIAAGILVCPGQ
jgi:Fe2+ transport system protein FeoA